jgi:hypothetical protein
VCWENPGRMDFGRLAAVGVGAPEMQRHYCFVNDYIWKRLSPGEVSHLLIVLLILYSDLLIVPLIL